MAKLSVNDKICVIITSLFGVGFAPLFGGTLASVVAVAVFLLVKSQFYFSLITVFSIILAFALSGHAEKIWDEKDSKKIVIDDFCGMLVSLLFIPYDMRMVACGFVVFRLFDAFKVPPIDRIENLKGAAGVVGDDIAAGLYTLVILHITKLFI
ncbi:MAG: phosphatidylglycerophosphatase A [Candidatus Omnitrophota bacterium]